MHCGANIAKGSITFYSIKCGTGNALEADKVLQDEHRVEASSQAGPEEWTWIRDEGEEHGKSSTSKTCPEPSCCPSPRLHSFCLDYLGHFPGQSPLSRWRPPTVPGSLSSQSITLLKHESDHFTSLSASPEHQD